MMLTTEDSMEEPGDVTEESESEDFAESESAAPSADFFNEPALSLIDEKNGWVSCEYVDGTKADLDLRSVLKQAHHIRRISLENPASTAYLYSIVATIASRILDNPGIDYDSYADLDLPAIIPAAAVDDYFEEFGDRFYLLHPLRPFLQDVVWTPEDARERLPFSDSPIFDKLPRADILDPMSRPSASYGDVKPRYRRLETDAERTSMLANALFYMRTSRHGTRMKRRFFPDEGAQRLAKSDPSVSKRGNEGTAIGKKQKMRELTIKARLTAEASIIEVEKEVASAVADGTPAQRERAEKKLAAALAKIQKCLEEERTFEPLTPVRRLPGYSQTTSNRNPATANAVAFIPVLPTLLETLLVIMPRMPEPGVDVKTSHLPIWEWDSDADGYPILLGSAACGLEELGAHGDLDHNRERAGVNGSSHAVQFIRSADGDIVYYGMQPVLAPISPISGAEDATAMGDLLASFYLPLHARRKVEDILLGGFRERLVEMTPESSQTLMQSPEVDFLLTGGPNDERLNPSGQKPEGVEWALSVTRYSAAKASGMPWRMGVRALASAQKNGALAGVPYDAETIWPLTADARADRREWARAGQEARDLLKTAIKKVRELDKSAGAPITFWGQWASLAAPFLRDFLDEGYSGGSGPEAQKAEASILKELDRMYMEGVRSSQAMILVATQRQKLKFEMQKKLRKTS